MNNLDLFLSENGYLLVIISLWSLAWKGIALWESAGNKDKYWFIAILVLNTLGLLPIFYLFYKAGYTDKVKKFLS